VTGGVERRALSFQSGNSSVSARGSITAPERMCAPTSAPFSIRQTLMSALSCFRRIAAAKARRAAAHDDDVEFHGFALHADLDRLVDPKIIILNPPPP
jgi:hypothetical protein